MASTVMGGLSMVEQHSKRSSGVPKALGEPSCGESLLIQREGLIVGDPPLGISRLLPRCLKEIMSQFETRQNAMYLIGTTSASFGAGLVLCESRKYEWRSTTTD